MNTINQLVSDSIEVEEVNKILDEYGVAIVPDYLSSQVVSKLKSEFDDFISSPDTHYKKKTPYSNGKCSRVSFDTLDVKRYNQTSAVFSSDFMNSVAYKFFEDSKFKLNSEIFVVKDVIGSRHIANDLHFDVNPTLKFFIYLTDTREENGAFSCVPGSHLETKKIRKKYKNQIDYKNRDLTRDLPVENEDIISIEGDAGTLIIFTTETFHKAGIVTHGERLVMRGHTREESKHGILKRIKASIKNIFKNNE